jgi:autotransporter passenger strand-loop-strand repeat protein
MSGRISAAQFAQLQNDFIAIDGSNLPTDPNFAVGSTLYADIIADISEYYTIGQNVFLEVAPTAGIDTAVYDWIYGAQSVNQNSGFFGQFIVDYTEDQFNIRSTISLSGTAAIAKASNDIAYQVYESIFDSVNPDGSHNLPSIQTLETFDAGGAAALVFETIYGSPDVAGWAGTLLFPFLRDSSFFQNYLLSTTPETNATNGLNKDSPSLYDLAAALDAGAAATLRAFNANKSTALQSALLPIYTNIPTYSTVIAPELTNDINRTNTIFSTYYNLPMNNEFAPGDDLVIDAGYIADAEHFLAPINTYVVGYATAADDITQTASLTYQAVIVGGTGNNTIVAPVSGNDLIDGGVGGRNTIDLSDIYGPLTITVGTDTIEQQLTITTPSGDVDSDGSPVPASGLRTIYAYQFADLNLGNGNDTLSLTGTSIQGLQDITIGSGNNTISSSIENLTISIDATANSGSSVSNSDTFYHLASGSTIITGSEGQYTLSVSENTLDIVSAGGTQAIALPSGFVVSADSQNLAYVSGDPQLIIDGGDNQTIDATVANEIVIGTGSSDTLVAGANNVTLVSLDSSGTNMFGSPENNPSIFSNLSEISVDASTTSQNVFVANYGTNVLIGGAGTNTFISDGEATNIIWGGGGTSTYQIPGDVDIIYTNGDVTAQDIENLSVSELSETLPKDPIYTDGHPSYAPGMTYIIDPGPNDQLSFLGTLGVGTPVNLGEAQSGPGQSASGTTYYYGYSNGPGFLAFDEGAPSPGINYTDLGDGQVVFSEVLGVPIYGNEFSQLYLTGNEVFNFVNGDLGATFSGSSPFYITYESDVSVQDSSITADQAYNNSNPENVFSETERQVIDFGNGGNSIVGSGDTEFVASGGSDVALTIAGGGDLNVTSGGTVASDIVLSSGTENVQTGGQSYNDLIVGGLVSVSSGGIEDGAIISSDGSLTSTFGPSSSTITSGEGLLSVLSGAVASNTTLESGGWEIINSGGISNNSTIEDGGILFSLPGATSSNATILAGGRVISAGILIFQSNDIEFYPTSTTGISLSGSTEYLFNGGVSDGTTITSSYQYVFVGGTSMSDIFTGGTQNVLAGGISNFTTLENGATQIVTSGGVSNNDIIENVNNVQDGTIIVLSGGKTNYGNLIYGQEDVDDGGIATGITLGQNGIAYVTSGGDLPPNFPPLKSRVLGCRHAHRDGVSRFG